MTVFFCVYVTRFPRYLWWSFVSWRGDTLIVIPFKFKANIVLLGVAKEWMLFCCFLCACYTIIPIRVNRFWWFFFSIVTVLYICVGKSLEFNILTTYRSDLWPQLYLKLQIAIPHWAEAKNTILQIVMKYKKKNYASFKFFFCKYPSRNGLGIAYVDCAIWVDAKYKLRFDTWNFVWF